jgi:hypothetical protein
VRDLKEMDVGNNEEHMFINDNNNRNIQMR